MLKPSNLNKYCSNINIINLFFGFNLITSIFFSNASTELTSSITIPYRFFSLFLSFLVIILNIKKFKYISKDALILIIFYLAYIGKIFISITFDRSAFNPGTDFSLYYLNSIGIVFIPLLSILVSYHNFNYDKILKWSFYLSFITSILILYKSSLIGLQSADQRLDANIALSTITFGHIGTTLFILSVALFKFKKSHIIFAIVGIFLGIFVSIISGSRSPILALLIVILIITFTLNSHRIASIIISIVFIFSLVIFSNFYLRFIDQYSHATSGRIAASIIEGDSGNRDSYFSAAINQFIDSPLIGDNFILKNGLGKGDYPHNLILEALLAFGFLGGIILIYLYIKCIIFSFQNIKNNTNLKWLGLLFFQFLIFVSLHGSLWRDSLYIILMGLILSLYSKEKKRKRLNIQ